jgi:proteasome lid subunit RPN8/RPN11
MIRLSAGAEARIRSESERSYPDECCGLLLGGDDGDGTRTVQGIAPVRNAGEAGERGRRFAIGPDDFLRAELEAREKGMDVIGVYHSHPDRPALPSDRDLEYALPHYSYIIVAARNGRAAELGGFVLAPDRSGFLRERLSPADAGSLQDGD